VRTPLTAIIILSERPHRTPWISRCLPQRSSPTALVRSVFERRHPTAGLGGHGLGKIESIKMPTTMVFRIKIDRPRMAIDRP
jgi:hypothetical protein